jgi:hypothetical protein
LREELKKREKVLGWRDQDESEEGDKQGWFHPDSAVDSSHKVG